MNTTFRLIVLGESENFGRTAASQELAKLAPGELERGNNRLGIERTDWTENFGKWKPVRTVLVEVEDTPGEWDIGV